MKFPGNQGIRLFTNCQKTFQYPCSRDLMLLLTERQLTERFHFKAVAITLRGSISASENNWSGMLYKDGQAHFARNYLIKLVDRVGGGDSFGGGLIHAMRKWPDDLQQQIEFAVAASCLKQATEFDFNLASEKEVLALAGGNASGRVQR